MTDGQVHYRRDGAVATVTFDRPAARNAMTWHMYEQLGEACARIRKEEGLRVAVFRGAGGKAFIAGTDIAQFQAFRSGEDGIAYEEKMEGTIGGVETLPVPTLAVIEGFAIGGGLAIAAACDLRIATPGSRFGVPIARTLGKLPVDCELRPPRRRARGVTCESAAAGRESRGRGGAGIRLRQRDRGARRSRPPRWRNDHPPCAACTDYHARKQGGDPSSAACGAARWRRSRARVLRQR
jgi:enoyl-CoA hydratase/carnithine racemase